MKEGMRVEKGVVMERIWTLDCKTPPIPEDLTIVPSAIIVDVTVPESAAVIAVPEILVLSIAADALMSALTIVESAIIVEVTVPVSP